MEQIWRSLQESEEMVAKLKKAGNNLDPKIQLARTRVDIKKAEQQDEIDEILSRQLDQLDIAELKELSDSNKTFEKQQILHLKKALADQRAVFVGMIAQERALSRHVLQQSRQVNEENLNNERKKIDTLAEQASEQLLVWENDRSKLMSIIQKLISLNQQQDARGNMNVNVPNEIRMPRSYFNIAVDYYCRASEVMKFKVFRVHELYSDLEKYDLRANLSEFSIASPATSVVYADFVEGLTYHGYKNEAEVYYLKPGLCEKPPEDLVKIDGPEDLQQMVHVHAEHGTKICLLYLVSIYGYQDPYADMQMNSPGESDEEAGEAETEDI